MLGESLGRRYFVVVLDHSHGGEAVGVGGGFHDVEELEAEQIHALAGGFDVLVSGAAAGVDLGRRRPLVLVRAGEFPAIRNFSGRSLHILMQTMTCFLNHSALRFLSPSVMPLVPTTLSSSAFAKCCRLNSSGLMVVAVRRTAHILVLAVRVDLIWFSPLL